MKTLVCGLAIALVLAGCHGHHDQAADDGAPAAKAEAGVTKDSVDPRLNALQRTKRTLGTIEADRKRAAETTEGAESP